MNTEFATIDTRLPAYARLRDTLTARIARGDWTPETPIPSEARLAREFDVSVGTVRKAVDGLVGEGLLERRQGSGTFVRAPSFNASLFRFFPMRDSDGAPVSIPQSRMLRRTPTTAPAEAEAALGTADVIQISRLRCLTEQPVLFEEIYIPRNRFPGFETLPDTAFGPLLYPVYFEKFGTLVKRATDEVSFDRASPPVAAQLHINPGDPLAVIRRTAFDIEGTAVEWRIASGSAAGFRYRSEIN
ncbi:transcriptional regulator, GntR family [Pseudooceanicola nitratireducens]|jgi:GntR family transcriptional regulator|uniref:Transcriptional regulator, GntR family n=1 Tax=Pseudooceanicola nitratireducens TaxID=517719 RepID=A0A1I1KMT4_9RHOB|nr:GntR family transcriptional regulator [Pseudooceanicola nitratireducens]SEJ45613.1 GntR family transcriptional regulator [Pseudooceanicola nitratireducens]SFC59968.1 transcriptional regulator, GntR family [Pseudooceanicola nitratireducens]